MLLDNILGLIKGPLKYMVILWAAVCGLLVFTNFDLIDLNDKELHYAEVVTAFLTVTLIASLSANFFQPLYTKHIREKPLRQLTFDEKTFLCRYFNKYKTEARLDYREVQENGLIINMLTHKNIILTTDIGGGQSGIKRISIQPWCSKYLKDNILK
jgi:hypothetical protein